MMDTLAERLEPLRRRLVATARHVRGARVLIDAIYGVGPLNALALCSWLGGAGRFSSSRKAVRFTGLDITVHSLRHQTQPRPAAPAGTGGAALAAVRSGQDLGPQLCPGHRYYTEVTDRYDANRATLSQARRIVRQAVYLLTDLGEDTFTIIAQPAAPTMVTR